MLWVAAGVGITPFLAMYRGLQNNSHDYNIDLLYSCRGDEVALIKSMNLGSIRIRVFDSSETSERHDNILYSVTPRRLRQDDFEHIADISDRVAYLCGPVGFMADVRGWLHSHLSPEHVLFEKFDF
jgi:ferredoxin-NADP reductase